MFNSKHSVSLETMEDLLKRDAQRAKDGFPKKIKTGTIPTPGGKIILVPTVEEEKLVHYVFEPGSGGGGQGGQGEEQEGEVIKEKPLGEEGEAAEGEEGEENAPGGESGGEHGVEETEAYKLGQQLIKDLELPLPDKGKKIRVNEYVYDLTDCHPGTGQVLDKKRTLREIVKTNQALGLLDPSDPDPTKLVISPHDKIYRVLSREKAEKSQAVVFFLRDYSGSMAKELTQAVVYHHVLIYSWLMAHYEKLVKLRFILHDTDAEEVFDFETYYRAAIAGGTKVASAYKLVNKIVEEERLAQDYNIFVFHGTDGDDWDTDGKEALPEVRKILEYVHRMGIFVVRNDLWGSSDPEKTVLEKYIEGSKLAVDRADKLRIASRPSKKLNDQEHANVLKHLLGFKKK